MLDNNQLQHFRERQLVGLMDTCRQFVYSSSANDYNEKIATYTDLGTDIPCGLDQATSNERMRAADTVLQYDATIRLTIDDGKSFSVRDRIQITKRFGETLDTPITYEIVSPAQRGPSGIRFLLKKVEL